MLCNKPDPNNRHITNILVEISNNAIYPIRNIALQAAVPKHLHVTVSNPTHTEVASSGYPAKVLLKIINYSHNHVEGHKKIELQLKVSLCYNYQLNVNKDLIATSFPQQY